ncbi:DNA packaging protein UL32-like protein [Phocid alphaherpesvirus 1]|uniref:Packaging protein UL32 n=1 Tax=Phocid alphaherpesvirus 1 TaxID=47418 RepID=A0A482F3S0_9ALPH|nr:DNA packaging protein UL32-like protein [Phocid alphaherpesvirus 1]QBN85153.1 DNA packaging protein UL32-like protein [Phocid alphaherpesvirus 1]UNP64248.1 DNA packaging protein UL32-like protein [Phocid alphaherpesvirus 1]
MARLLIADENITWKKDAFLSPYISFNPALLNTNDTLCNELIFASHIMQIPRHLSSEEFINEKPIEECDGVNTTPDITLFVESVSDCLALDRPCMVCRIIDLYNKQFGLNPKWISDYAMLCSKSLASPLCAIGVFVVAFEFVYIMDKYYLKNNNVTLVGSFARRVLNIIDIQKHFFLHVCFRTDGGLPSTPFNNLNNLNAACKVQYSNYSFLVQSAIKALFLTTTDNSTLAMGGQKRGDELVSSSPFTGIKNQSLTTALVSWKDCAKLIDCSSSENKKIGIPTCCAKAILQDEEYEKCVTLNDKECIKNWGYVDLLFLLLSNISTWNSNDKIVQAAEMRKTCVESYWNLYKRKLFMDTAPKFMLFANDEASPDMSLGPILLTTLKHTQCRGKTNSECLLCNLLIVKDYWVALRQFKRDILNYSANNAGLFDCIPPVLESWKTLNEKTLDDGDRFITLMSAVGTEAIYKHFFCDPMCTLSELQTNPRVLFDHPSYDDSGDLELYKAQLATENKFECRICAGLWTLAYTFKTYQVFPPKPTAGAAFIKDAGLILRRHNISLVSLEHTLCNYV